MSLLKQIKDKGATLAWSPVPGQGNVVALGTRDGGGAAFEEHGGELEIHRLDFSNRQMGTKLVGTVRSGRFQSLAWSAMATKRGEFPLGLVAGGFADGGVGIWDPAKLAANHPQPRIALVQKHVGAVNGLQFNPIPDHSHLLASAGADNEVYVINLDKPEAPTFFVPAPAPSTAKHTAEVNRVAWNTQVPHILASCSANGSTIIWDLRQKKPWCELRDAQRGSVTDIAWNPDEGQNIVTASGNDDNPLIKLWDLRSSTSMPFATLKGHTQGVLSVSWCPFDSTFMLSTGRDNRTLLWDLFNHSQPAYELPASTGAGEAEMSSVAFGGFGRGESRRYSALWSPTIPAVIGTCSFERNVEFFSLAGVSSGRAPRWLRRPCSATFGWGGKLTYVQNEVVQKGARMVAPGKRPVVKVAKVVEDEALVKASRLFEQAKASNDYRAYCQSKAETATTGEERQVWAILQTVVDKDSKSQLNRFLGFEDKAASPAKPPSQASGASPRAAASGSPAPPSLLSPSARPASATDLFSGDGPGEPAPAEAMGELSLAPKPLPPVSAAEAAAYSEAESKIKVALVSGGLEKAVETALAYDLVAEALLLASSAGADLWSKTKDAYVAKHAAQRPLLRIIDSILKTDLTSLVASSSLANWRETLALISTYSKATDFPVLCEQLGARLETELGDHASATLCYLCSANIGKAVRYWTDSLKDSKRKKGKVDTIALQQLIEKVTIILRAAPENPLTEDLAELFSEYASLLAAQGELTVAYQYAQSSDVPTAILRDRLYKSSVELQRVSQPPPFPFDAVNVGISATPNNAQRRPQPVVQQQQAAVTAAGRATGAAQASAGSSPQLPPNWTACTDPSSGRTYYANTVTRETTWEFPAAPQAAVRAPVPGALPATPSVGAYPVTSPATAGYPSMGATAVGGYPSGPQPVPTAVGAQAPSQASLGSAKPLGFYADGFTSSHGNDALAAKYGNTSPYTVPGASTMAAHNPMMQQQQQTPAIFQPVATPSGPAPVSSAPAPAPAPAPVPTELPAEVTPIIAGLNAIIDALNAQPHFTAGDKRQLGEISKAVGVLAQKLGSGELSGAVAPKILTFVQAVQTRDFGTAASSQEEFVKNLWDQNMVWIKAFKGLIQLAKK